MFVSGVIFVKKTQTRIEDEVQKFYESIDIYQPVQLDIEAISSRKGIIVEFADCLTHSTVINDVGIIVLNNKISDQQKWQSFGHELCHVIYHTGNQFGMHELFLDLQENIARQFMLKFCIPSHMLGNCINHLKTKEEIIQRMMISFCVERWFAEKRLEQYMRNLIFR